VREQSIALKNETNLSIFWWVICDTTAINGYLTCIWPIKSSDEAQGGRLPAARWSKQGKKFSSGKGEAYLVQCVYIPK